MRETNRFKGYTFASFRKDLISGFTVAIIAIPLGMAFAIASGVQPEYGIYTTIIAGILISLFGGSRYQIGGPTGAFVPILLAIVLQYGYENLLLAGFLAGILLILIGLFRFGSLIGYIPRPVTIGFTSGIAVIIFAGQIANFLGLSGIEKHEDFLSNMREIAAHLPDANSAGIIVALVSLAALLLMRRFAPRMPSAIVGIAASALTSALFFDGQTATIGSAYGEFSGAFPSFRIPNWSMDRMFDMVQPAIAIAFLGGIESLLSAVVADGMTGKRHDSNRELIGQGIANAVVPFFGGIPATGAIARTAANINSGAVSPVSGVIHGIFVLAIMLAFAPLAADIPLAGLAPVLMIVAWNMSERKQFVRILTARTSDSLILVATFLLTVFTDLALAVEIGMLLAAALFVKRMRAAMSVVKMLPDRHHVNGKVRTAVASDECVCPQFGIYTLEGPLFFGAHDVFDDMLEDCMRTKPRAVLLRMRNVPFVDASGEAKLNHLVSRLMQSECRIYVSGIQAQPLNALRRSGLYARIGGAQFFPHTGTAIAEALKDVDIARCAGCKRFAFRECSGFADGEAAADAEVIIASGATHRAVEI